MNQIGIGTRLLTEAEPGEAQSDFLDILEHIPSVRILGPDEAGAVWLTGKTAKGLPVSLALGKVGDVIADAALGWRSARELAF